MKNLKGRLDRLEQTADATTARTQCANCHDWPAVHARTLNADGSVTDETPEVPMSCTRCGWVPVQVTFEIMEDWRSVGRSTQ
jgi:hypothetical protein